MFRRDLDYPSAYINTMTQSDSDTLESVAIKWVTGRHAELGGTLLVVTASNKWPHFGPSIELQRRPRHLHVSHRTFARSGWTGGPVLMLYGTNSTVTDDLAHDHRTRALCVVTQTPRDLQTWIAESNAIEL